MFHFLKRDKGSKMPSGSENGSPLTKPLSAIAVPGMYLFYKYSEFMRQQQESHRKKVTEKELDHLNHKIDKLLAKFDDKETEPTEVSPSKVSPSSTTTTATTTTNDDEECVICMSAKATMQTFPCGHKVICKKCFIKTIQVAVSQRCLPLKCVICRTRILKLKQSSTTVKMQSSKRSKTPSSKPRFSRSSKVYAK